MKKGSEWTGKTIINTLHLQIFPDRSKEKHNVKSEITS